jgi:hypothetical protein
MRYVVSMMVCFLFYNLSLYGKDFNMKSLVGKWEMVEDKKPDKIMNVEIKYSNDSVLIYTEDTFGNYNKSISFVNKPTKKGPKGIMFNFEQVKISENDTIDFSDFYQFSYSNKTVTMFINHMEHPRNLNSDNLHKNVNVFGLFYLKKRK